MKLLAIIFILIILIVLLIFVAIAQLRAAGIKVTDFYSFVKANESLDQLYIFAERYNKMTPQEQLIYLMEAEKMLAAFDKVPDVMWSDEQNKYDTVVDTYKKIRLDRWNRENELKSKKASSKSNVRKPRKKAVKRIQPKEIKFEKT